jgi:hypothetical protein
MPFVSGFLRIRDQGLPGSGEHPEHGLPDPETPVDPGWGIPEAPPGVFPPPVPSHPIVIAPPDTPPGQIWPPIRPPYVWGQGPRPGHDLPTAPPVTPGTPPPRPTPQPPENGGEHPEHGLPQQKYWVIVGIPGYGWRYVCIQPTPVPPRPQPTPPEAEPKPA